MPASPNFFAVPDLVRHITEDLELILGCRVGMPRGEMPVKVTVGNPFQMKLQLPHFKLFEDCYADIVAVQVAQPEIEIVQFILQGHVREDAIVPMSCLLQIINITCGTHYLPSLNDRLPTSISLYETQIRAMRSLNRISKLGNIVRAACDA